MKILLVAAIVTLFTTSVHAQTGLPQELTCTEKAFNVSFSLGTKWKFSPPKMGPVEASTYENDYNAMWSSKVNLATPIPSSATGLSDVYLAYAIHPQNHATDAYANSFKIIDKSDHSFTYLNFSPAISYILKSTF